MATTGALLHNYLAMQLGGDYVGIMVIQARVLDLSEATHDAIAWMYGILFCWGALLLLATGYFVTFVGNSWEADIALIVMIATAFIMAINWLIIVGMKRRITGCWHIAVLFLLLHLMGLLAPVAVFGLIKLFKLEAQADFGLARSPSDPLREH